MAWPPAPAIADIRICLTSARDRLVFEMVGYCPRIKNLYKELYCTKAKRVVARSTEAGRCSTIGTSMLSTRMVDAVLVSLFAVA
jgi:hypothetical protein